jgi:hypothetical protein
LKIIVQIPYNPFKDLFALNHILSGNFHSLRIRMRYVAGRSILKVNIGREFYLKRSTVKDMWQLFKSKKSNLYYKRASKYTGGRWNTSGSFETLCN